MKKALTIAMSTLMMAASCTAKQSEAQSQDTSAQAEGEKKVLVAYFSCTGTTEAAARAIAQATGGTLYRIAPKEEYTQADLDWRDKQSRSSLENANAQSRPELANHDANVEAFDVVFLGYPIWWNVCPRAVNTFMEAYNFKGKTVIPFATSGGSTIAGSERELRRLYADGINWQPGRLLGHDQSEIAEWAKGMVK